MGNLKINESNTTDMTTVVEDYEVANASVSKETTYENTNWAKWYGYLKDVPKLQAVIKKKAMWTIGKGVEADAKTLKQLSKIRGFGKDTFNTILNNAIVVYTTGGDSYAEIIKKNGRLINLKPLSPATMRTVANQRGIIVRYEQMSDGKVANKFKPEQIFHLCWDRVSDEIHGTSTVEKIEDVILAIKEGRADLKTVFHRYVKPLWIFSVDTDDETEITAFKQKVDKTVSNAENLVVPKDTVDNIERVSIPQYSTLDPLPWIHYLDAEFMIAEGVPEIILGSGDSTTEATAKILYLAFQQTIEWNQLFLSEQIEAQLGLKVKFKFPASIEPALTQDTEKARNTNNMEMGLDAKK